MNRTKDNKIIINIDDITGPGVSKELIVGRCVRVVRNFLGQKQMEFASLIGIHQINLSRIETGKAQELNTQTLLNLHIVAEACNLGFCAVIFEEALSKIKSFKA